MTAQVVPMIANLGPTEIILIILVLVLLFGAKKLPDAARSLGQSMRIFKSEVKEMKTDPKPDAEKPATPIASERVDTPEPHAEPTDKRPA